MPSLLLDPSIYVEGLTPIALAVTWPIWLRLRSYWSCSSSRSRAAHGVDGFPRVNRSCYGLLGHGAFVANAGATVLVSAGSGFSADIDSRPRTQRAASSQFAGFFMSRPPRSCLIMVSVSK